MPYGEAAALQRATMEAVIRGELPDILFFVEHDPVMTLGANFHSENLLLNPGEYAQRGIEVSETERGGDVTFHGPKQLVMYPIFRVDAFGKDLHKWLRDLEEVVIQMVKRAGLEGERFAPHTGVWVNGRKLAAIGIKVRKWVSMHGIALNCNNDLSPFDLIVPCGIVGYGVTSLSREAGQEIGVELAKSWAKDAFASVFKIELVPESLAELRSRLG